MIKVAEPSIGDLEKAYVQLVLARNQLSMGDEVAAFEERFVDICFNQPLYGVSCSSGTTALHLALAASGIGPGDEVIVPNITYIATANAARYCGATVRLVDVREDDWTISYEEIVQLVNPKTKAIILVDLYGVIPSDYPEIRTLCSKNKILLVEDAAQGIGAERSNRDGTKTRHGYGDVTTYSFFGNKIMTAGEGGIAVFRNKDAAQLAKKLRGQGQSEKTRYWHDIVGYNYRMTELQAAILNAQLLRLDELLSARMEVWRHYQELLADISWISEQYLIGTPSPWLKTVILSEAHLMSRQLFNAEQAGHRMAARGVETRPVFRPIHRMGVYSERGLFPVSDRIAQWGISLPTHPNLTKDDCWQVVQALIEASS